MATFTAHSALGAGTMGAAAKIIGLDPLVPVIYGAVFGSGPDTFDWIRAQFGYPRWEWYSIFHAYKPWWLVWNPPWLLHLITDEPFHKNPGENWWPRLWWLELLHWIVGGLLLWFAFQR